ARALLPGRSCECRLCLARAVLLLRPNATAAAPGRPGRGPGRRPGVRDRPAAAWRPLRLARPLDSDDLLGRGAAAASGDVRAAPASAGPGRRHRHGWRAVAAAPAA